MQIFKKSNQNMVLRGSTLTVFALFIVLMSGMNFKLAAQDDDDREITINMSATELLPADKIIFNININAEAGSPQEAFEMHKKRESVLADLLKEFKIKDEYISYDPIRINKNFRGRDDDQVIVTNQSVSVTLDDFEIYETIQVGLIDNGFNNFSGNFSSSEIETGKETALKKAIKSAREKAEIITKTAGVKLDRVIQINYSDHQIGYPKSYQAFAMEEAVRGASMMDFQQTVAVTANISITFGIE